MLLSEGDSANVQSVEPNKTTSDEPVTDKNKTAGDDSVTNKSSSPEDLNSDSDSVVPTTDQPGELEMSEDQTKLVEFEPPLHSFSLEEDKELLGKCWMTNLSPR